jgi:hypothetical protein
VAQFLDPLIVREISDSIFQTVEPFRYQSDLVKEVITVAPLFFTDFASCPRLGFIYALLGDRAHEPAVVHDWLYLCGKTTRLMADNVLLEAMTVKNLPWYQKYPIYWGVRAGGWVAWNTHRAARDTSPVPPKFPVPERITPVAVPHSDSE